MRLLDMLRYRLRVLLHPGRHASELDEEIRFHLSLESMQREHAARGALSATDAQWAAQRRFGNLTTTKEEAREMAGLGFFDTTEQDVRFALRSFRRSPGFTAVAVLTLAVGIGANTAIFSAVNAMLLRPLPFEAPDRLMQVSLTVPARGDSPGRDDIPWSYPKFAVFRKAQTIFKDITLWSASQGTIRVGADAERTNYEVVDGHYLQTFGIRPAIGRNFSAEEDATPGGAKVVILSDAFWQRRFNADSAVLGRSVSIDGDVFTIVGVLPAGFRGISGRAELFVSYMSQDAQMLNEPFSHGWDMIARLGPGVTPERAKVVVRQLGGVVADAFPNPRIKNERWGAIARELDRTRVDPVVRRSLLVLLGAVGLVLLIACANVANLFLARALRRRREVALRLALGVTYRRLAAQSLTESLVLSLAGCVAGLAIAQWGGAALRTLFLPSTAFAAVAADWRTLGVALIAAVLAGLLTGFSPLLLSRDADIARSLKAGVREGTSQRSRMRAWLLVVQVVLSVVLLVGAGLFVRSLARLRDLRLGYDVDPVLLVRWDRRGETVTPEQRAALHQRVLGAAREIPGVTRASWASNIPLQGTSTMPLYVPGIDSVARLGRFTYQTAGVDYFAAIGTRVTRGRGFTAEDRAGSPTVAVVSASMARVLWPGQDALGQCMRVGADTMPCTQVVGVAEDAVHDALKDQPFRYYLPVDQSPNEGSSLLVLRLRGSPAEMAENVRQALQAVMPGQQYVTTQPMSDLLGAQRRSWRAGATMFVAFGVLALVVAAVGVYGVIAYDVGQRMHELGVRIALGARGMDVVRLVVTRGVRLALAGIAVGAALAMGAGRWIEPLLFHQSASDPAVFGLVALVLVAVAVAACSAPAARAVRADPNTVLRAD